MDSTGRHSFPEMLRKDQNPLGLAVFENWFFWADKQQLLYADRTSLNIQVLLNKSVSSFAVLHELQQPPSKSVLLWLINRGEAGLMAPERSASRWRCHAFMQHSLGSSLCTKHHLFWRWPRRADAC